MRFYTRQHATTAASICTPVRCTSASSTETARTSSTRTCRRAAELSRGGRAVSRGSRRRRGVHLHLVLARRPLRRRNHPLRPRPRALHEGDPRRQGQERPHRLPEDRDAGARRDAAPGLRLPGRHARHPRSAAPAPAARPQARRADRPHPDHQPASTTSRPSRSASPTRAIATALPITSTTPSCARASRSISHCSIATTRCSSTSRATSCGRQAARRAGLPAAALHPRRRQGAGPHDPLRDPHRAALRPGAGVRLLRAAREVRKESAGKKHGTSGAKMGNVHLKWAFSEAAVLFVRHNDPGKKLLARLEKRARQGQGAEHPRAQARPCRLLHAAARQGVRDRTLRRDGQLRERGMREPVA